MGNGGEILPKELSQGTRKAWNKANFQSSTPRQPHAIDLYLDFE